MPKSEVQMSEQQGRHVKKVHRDYRREHQGTRYRSYQTRRENRKNSDLLNFSSGCRGLFQTPYCCSLIVTLQGLFVVPSVHV